ncbi:unnamed protein product, partial [Brenthis ino]
MFKFVALCCFLAAASATPGLIAPVTYSSNVLAPAPAVYSSYPSNGLWSSPLISSAPLVYSGFPHYIKKRSVGFGSYFAPSSYIASGPYAYNAYTATAPLVSTYSAAAPLATYSSPVYTTAAHLIKKRSAPFYLPSSYVASAPYTAAAPFVASSYAAASPIAPVWSSSLYPAASYAHFIKKRSVALPLSYTAPSSFSHTSRFDYHAASPAVTTYASYPGVAPLAYSSPVAIQHLI